MTNSNAAMERLIIDLMQELQNVLELMKSSDLDRQITELMEEFRRMNGVLERVVTAMESSAKTSREASDRHHRVDLMLEETRKRDAAVLKRLSTVETAITDLRDALFASMQE